MIFPYFLQVLNKPCLCYNLVFQITNIFLLMYLKVHLGCVLVSGIMIRLFEQYYLFFQTSHHFFCVFSTVVTFLKFFIVNFLLTPLFYKFLLHLIHVTIHRSPKLLYSFQYFQTYCLQKYLFQYHVKIFWFFVYISIHVC